eukprot:5814964-Ditylum_brightwellii.AAC.1
MMKLKVQWSLQQCRKCPNTALNDAAQGIVNLYRSRLNPNYKLTYLESTCATHAYLLTPYIIYV